MLDWCLIGAWMMLDWCLIDTWLILDWCLTDLVGYIDRLSDGSMGWCIVFWSIDLIGLLLWLIGLSQFDVILARFHLLVVLPISDRLLPSSGILEQQDATTVRWECYGSKGDGHGCVRVQGSRARGLCGCTVICGFVSVPFGTKCCDRCSRQSGEVPSHILMRFHLALIKPCELNPNRGHVMINLLPNPTK